MVWSISAQQKRTCKAYKTRNETAKLAQQQNKTCTAARLKSSFCYEQIQSEPKRCTNEWNWYTTKEAQKDNHFSDTSTLCWLNEIWAHSTIFVALLTLCAHLPHRICNNKQFYDVTSKFVEWCTAVVLRFRFNHTKCLLHRIIKTQQNMHASIYLLCFSIAPRYDIPPHLSIGCRIA